MNKIKFIYFDIGGVMADTTNYFIGSMTKFGIPVDKFTKLWEENFRDGMTRGKITSQEFWKKAVKKFNINDAEDYNFVDSWMGDYVPRPEVHDLAKRLSKKYKIGLISNLYSGMMPGLIKMGKVADIDYSAIILSCETGLDKKEKKIFEVATKKAKVKAEEIFFIDDRKIFIEMAKLTGWQTFWFNENNIDKSIKQIEKLLEI